MRKLYLRSAFFCVAVLICVASVSAIAQDYTRPETGTFVKDSERNGYGVLVVENNNLAGDEVIQDAVAILTDQDNNTIIAVYVREGESFEITGIEDGLYGFYFTVGDGWNLESARFSDPEFYKAENPLPFETEIDGLQVLYSQWTLSLEEVPGGNEEKVPVPEYAFPDLVES